MMNLNPLFKPDYTPKEMFNLGVFEGNYFQQDLDLPSMSVAIHPKAMRVLAGVSPDKLMNKNPSKDRNFYKSTAGSKYDAWKEKGWLRDQDPYGWVNWYINYTGGIRTEDDSRQIGRWLAFKRRHLAMSRKYPNSNKIKQGLLQWAIKA